MSPDQDDIAISFVGKLDEFHPYWHRARLREQPTNCLLRLASKPALVATDAVSQSRVLVRLSPADVQLAVLARPFSGPRAAALHFVGARPLAVVLLASDVRRCKLTARPTKRGLGQLQTEGRKTPVGQGEKNDTRQNAKCLRIHSHSRPC